MSEGAHPASDRDPRAIFQFVQTFEALEAGLDQVRASPADNGTVVLIVRRPREGEREELAEGVLDPAAGLVGDSWLTRKNFRRPDGVPNPEMQLNVINARLSALVAGEPGRRALAGDQLHLDLDLSERNLPAGSRLLVGSAVIEVTAEPHRGCKKFSSRYGLAALAFVNSELGKQLRLRGLNARVIKPGVVRPGDMVKKL